MTILHNNIMKSTLSILSCFIILISYPQEVPLEQATWNYPIIAPDTAIDNYFGMEVIDPYRNIENLEDALVKTWYAGQRAFYDSVMYNITSRDSIKEEINNLNNQRTYWSDLPRAVGEDLFFARYSYATKAYTLNYMPSIADALKELFNLDSINMADSVEYRIDYYEPSYDANFVAFIGVSIYIYNMDVYHHIKTGVNYPSILFSAGLNDPRVSPWQTGKTVARLQSLNSKNNIILFNISDKGHSRFSESADSFSFLFWQFAHPEFTLKYPKNKIPENIED